MTLPRELRRRQADVAVLSRWSPGSDALVVARENFEAAYAEYHARQVVARLSKLRPEQRARIAEILSPVIADNTADAQ